METSLTKINFSYNNMYMSYVTHVFDLLFNHLFMKFYFINSSIRSVNEVFFLENIKLMYSITCFSDHLY